MPSLAPIHRARFWRAKGFSVYRRSLMEKLLSNFLEGLLEKLILPCIATMPWIIGIYQRFPILWELVRDYRQMICYIICLAYIIFLLFANKILEAATLWIADYLHRKRGAKHARNLGMYFCGQFKGESVGRQKLQKLEGL